LNHQHRIVSSEEEKLILVDSDDNEIGYASKARCHNGEGVLHRAFSLFLFNEAGELLLQQRGEDKRLWPGFWSNSCCSHPRRGETLEVATARRLSDELNIEAELEHIYRFSYQAGFGGEGSEHELCHVYLGRTPTNVRPNDSEIAAIRFLSPGELDREMSGQAHKFTPWFQQEWQELKGNYRQQLTQYCELS